LISTFFESSCARLPEAVKTQVQALAVINIAGVRRMLVEGGVVAESESEAQARARGTFAAVAGAQLVASGRADMALYDSMIKSYRKAGLSGPCSLLLE
jgi:TetR/AcrR family transcriptional repressor of nem operon